MYHIPFKHINWDNVEKIEHKGETGTSFWQTLILDGLRVRIVQYSANYLADHWCQKGHIVHCLEGSFISEMEGVESITLTKGTSYIVSDDLSSHRSYSEHGAKLLIIDGGFLNPLKND
ncbi:MAG: DHCW motif cupin fold protein [Bacteroidota bacterium]